MPPVKVLAIGQQGKAVKPKKKALSHSPDAQVPAEGSYCNSLSPFTFRELSLHSAVNKPLSKLSPELQTIIFEKPIDDSVTSVCLGLTCKAFNEIHKTFHHGPISLNATVRCGYDFGVKAMLRSFLYKWMGPNMFWDFRTSRFVGAETMEAIEQQFADGLEVAQAR